jgi:hypothetical protein
MMEGNNPFETFREALQTRGVSLRWTWTARRDGTKKKYHDVGYVTFTGAGFQPKVLGAIVVDYGGESGFGLFIDNGNTIEADADAIAGKRNATTV